MYADNRVPPPLVERTAAETILGLNTFKWPNFRHMQNCHV